MPIRDRLRARTAAILALATALVPAAARTQDARVFEVVLQAGHLESGPDTLRVDQGAAIELRIASDVPGELHLHGYDIVIDLRAGKTATVALDATVAGRFPITSHGFAGEAGGHHHRALLYLEVYPR